MPYNFYPSTEYNGVLVTDILKRFQFSDKYRKSSFVENYTVKDGETPEALAFYLYKDANYSWVILMLNNITDRNSEWSYSYRDLQNILKNKYSGSSLFYQDVTFSIQKAHTLKAGQITYLVKSIDRNFNKIVTFDKVTIVPGQKITLYDIDGKLLGPRSGSAEITITRVVYEDLYSIHHFEQNGLYIDPRQDDVGTSTLISQYVNGEAEEYVVSNFNYELNVNDKKREIILAQENQIEPILESIQRLFLNVNKSNDILQIRQTVGDISE